MTKKVNKEDTIGSRLKFLRKRDGLNQVAIAQKLHFDVSILSRIENGHKEPTISMLKNMCELYHVTSDYILFGSDTDNSNNIDLTGFTSTQKNVIQEILNCMRCSCQNRK